MQHSLANDLPTIVEKRLHNSCMVLGWRGVFESTTPTPCWPTCHIQRILDGDRPTWPPDATFNDQRDHSDAALDILETKGINAFS